MTEQEVICLYAVRLEGRNFSQAGREIGLSKTHVRRSVVSAEAKLAAKGLKPNWPTAKAVREPMRYSRMNEIPADQSYSSGDDEPLD